MASLFSINYSPITWPDGITVNLLMSRHCVARVSVSPYSHPSEYPLTKRQAGRRRGADATALTDLVQIGDHFVPVCAFIIVHVEFCGSGGKEGG